MRWSSSISLALLPAIGSRERVDKLEVGVCSHEFNLDNNSNSPENNTVQVNRVMEDACVEGIKALEVAIDFLMV